MNKYLVCSTLDREEYFWNVYSSMEIFNRMDMADCTYEEITHIYLLPENGEPPMECRFHGVWHDSSDPLRMVIECNDEVISVGYGTDH